MADKRPPYISEADLDHLFDRITTIGEPKKVVDSAWVESYELASSQPPAVVSVLKWLNVIDDKGISTGQWNKLRAMDTRQETLTPLMEAAYVDIFDQVEVAQANRKSLQGAFITAYGSGDPGRQIKCFLALCKHAGIDTNDGKTRSANTSSRNGGKTKEPAVETPKRNRQVRQAQSNSQASEAGISLVLNVEIPADWPDERVRERITLVRQAATGH